MADSSNTEVDSQVTESTESKTTSNSNGNFSGGFDSSALSNEAFSVDSTPDFGIDFGPNNNSGSFDFSYNPFNDSGFDFGDGLSGDSDSSKTSEAYNKSEPVMTVDEVYGKGNQSIVENQGDYTASSNEKSNVETSTLGKQDEISVTPLSVAEDKGLVNNDAIQSVEGLNFQQKDKANQEVMEAKKSRDEAEAEDKADGMRGQLKADAEKTAAANKEGKDFQVGNKDKKEAELEENVKTAKQNRENLENEINEANKQKEELDKQKAEADKQREDKGAIQNVSYQDRQDAIKNVNNFIESKHAAKKAGFEPDLSKTEEEREADTVNDAKALGLNVNEYRNVVNQAYEAEEKFQAAKEEYIKADAAAKEVDRQIAENNKNLDDLNKGLEDARKAEEAANKGLEYYRGEHNTDVVKSKFEEAPSYKANIEAARNEINNSKDLSPEQKAEATSVLGNVETAADKMSKAANNLAANPNDINAAQKYVEETARYNKALKDAKGNNALKNTDFNKTFTKAVADANNFMVTRDDGTQQNYAEFAAEMVTKSPELAKGLYEAKAAKLAEDGHKVLAAIENAKSKMVMTWLGSKFTFADNQVRSQFNQMAKTDMRATYATYNNVLNDPDATPKQKAEASAAINQANSLMTASAALQASTGFLSGIGDRTSDGVYGKTDPDSLNAAQKALNTASNYAKIALGLGVTPGANKAYQNMYYMAGAKVNESGLFSRDFDKDGFALCQEYGNNAAVGMIAGAGELATGVAMFFNPSTAGIGINLAIDSVQTFINGLYGVQKDARKSQQYTQEVLSYFNEAKDIAEQSGNKEAVDSVSDAITQIENFELKADEVGNIDNWLEGSGSNTADNGKFNQALSYDEWLKLIEADPVMQEYAKSLNR